MSLLPLLALLPLSSPMPFSSFFLLMCRSNLQKIQNLINANRNDWSVISPAFQWAQGMNNVSQLQQDHL